MAFSENKPTETPEQLKELVRCGDWGRAPALPLAPYPEQPLSPLRRTAPLTPGSRSNPSVTLRRTAPLAQGSRSNPSVRYGGQLPLRRGAGERPSAAERPARRGAEATPQSHCGVTAPFFAPKRPFGTFRCFAWLIRIKEHTVLFYSKRSRFSRGAACARGSRRNPSVRCGGQLPLRRGAGERPSAAERARRGSRRKPRPD